MKLIKGGGSKEKKGRESMNSDISEKNVGKYFEHEDHSIWRLTSYASEPTAIMERVGKTCADEERHGVIGSQILSGFTMLVKKEEK